MRTEIESPSLTKVRALVEPIAADLGLDIYDIEHRGGTLRVTLDTPPGSPAGVALDILALASRLVSKELDQHDPMPSRYTLEVTSPGIERSLRTPAHFQREVGKPVAIRLADVTADQRRVQGVVESADDHAVHRGASPTGHRSASSTTRSTGPARCSSGGRNRSRKRTAGASRREQP